jgi:hypothetical protein
MRRSPFAAALLVFALTLFAMPAHAGKPSDASATATITVVGSCSFEVTYTWSGLSGSGLEAEVVLASKEPGGLELVYGWTFIPGQTGGSGSASATFTLTGTPSIHPYFGFGQLFKVGGKASIVRNSYAESGPLAPQACGSDVTIS